MKTELQVKCPECGAKVDVQAFLEKHLESERATIREQVQQEVLLKLKEKEKTIDDLRIKLDDAKRRAEQGSMQLQGEVQELEIIRILQELYPNDEITQSKKGANAADILQVIRLQNGVICGKLYFESKSTQSFSMDWIKKLKQDNLKVNADALVIVSHALPKGIINYGLIDDVWVCSFNTIKEFSLILRYSLIKLHAIAEIQQGKETKMQILFKYLTSVEFKNVFESIIGGFKSMQDSHNDEKLKMQRLWKDREKALEQILANSIEFYGTIRGIAGGSIPEIKSLESPKLD
jgi:hypothetical protein